MATPRPRRAPALLLAAALLAALLPALLASPSHADEEPVVITDVAITMEDGVRLAADVYLPPGTPTDGSVQVPCLVELTPYRKEMRGAEAASLLPFEGFGVVQVDVRGTGGSEGTYDVVFSWREQLDGAAVVDWTAREAPWCTERVGMFGGSYSGIIQYLVASLPDEHAPAHLAAIAPQRAYGDLYRDIVYHGGQLIGSFGVLWSSAAAALYLVPPTNVASEWGLSAWVDHVTTNDPILLPFLVSPYEDADHVDLRSGEVTQALYRDSSIHPHRIGALDVPTLHLAGWFDTFTRGQLLTFQAAHARERAGAGTGPHYLIVGPWNHTGTHFVEPANFPERLVAWYRHWLEDGPEPDWFGDDRVLYYEIGAGSRDDDTGRWATAREWPPAGHEHTRYHLRGDGGLTTEEPGADDAAVTYLYDPTTGLAGFPSRWDNAVPAVPHPEHDQRIDGDRSGATFQTDPLTDDVVVTGPITLRLHAATEPLDEGALTALPTPDELHHLVPAYHDTDFVVKLSDVAPDGTATLITEGFLRASHRALDPEHTQVAEGEVIVPHHPHTSETLDPPEPGEVREYWIEVWPTSKTFRAGHRIRLDVYSADTPNHLNLLRPALNTISTAAEAPSYLLLPVQAASADPDEDDDVIAPPPAADPPLPATGAGAGTLPAFVLLLLAARVLAASRRSRPA